MSFPRFFFLENHHMISLDKFIVIIILFYHYQRVSVYSKHFISNWFNTNMIILNWLFELNLQRAPRCTVHCVWARQKWQLLLLNYHVVFLFSLSMEYCSPVLPSGSQSLHTESKYIIHLFIHYLLPLYCLNDAIQNVIQCKQTSYVM